ncbi:hypothetical protein BH24GEM2_BH24GEM2_12790 [soil metagenome]
MLVRGILKLATLLVGSRGWDVFWSALPLFSGACLLYAAFLGARASRPANRNSASQASPPECALLKILGDPFRGQARGCVQHSLRMGGGFKASCSPFPTMPLSALGGLLLALVASACGAPLRATQAEAGASPRWYAVDQPPLVAGIRLGDSLAHMRSVLGSPTEYRRLVGGAHELVYWPPGLA